MTQFIELRQTKSGDVIVTSAGLVCTVLDANDDNIELQAGAGDSVGEIQSSRWGAEDFISPNDQVLLLHRPIEVARSW